ncbi:MAG: hypothetical protein AB9835_01865 [Eubacteriales bacterium]
MRCSSAVVQSLIMHPQFKNIPWVAEEAFKNACAQEDYRYTIVLPVEEAFKVIEAAKCKIIKTQRPTGGWKVKDSARISFWLLKALEYTGHLKTMIKDGSFHFDPFKPFKDGSDLYSFIIRKDLSKAPILNDAELGVKLTNEIYTNQDENGSWNGTVMSTCHNIEKLLLIGNKHDDERIRKGADWIFSTFNTDIIRQSNNKGGMIVAYNMFTSTDRKNEFLSASKEKPEWIPRQLCYNHLPNIQTGEAIKTLNMLGYEEDSRVISACENFVWMKENYGGWCDSNVRNTLIKESGNKRNDQA